MQKHILGLVLLLNLNLFSMDPKELDRRLEEANLRVAILGTQISELSLWRLRAEGRLQGSSLRKIIAFNSGCYNCDGTGCRSYREAGRLKACDCREPTNQLSMKLSLELLSARAELGALQEAIAKKASNE